MKHMSLSILTELHELQNSLLTPRISTTCTTIQDISRSNCTSQDSVVLRSSHHAAELIPWAVTQCLSNGEGRPFLRALKCCNICTSVPCNKLDIAAVSCSLFCCAVQPGAFKGCQVMCRHQSELGLCPCHFHFQIFQNLSDPLSKKTVDVIYVDWKRACGFVSARLSGCRGDSERLCCMLKCRCASGWSTQQWYKATWWGCKGTPRRIHSWVDSRSQPEVWLARALSST